jgi:hypothetical protein
LYFLNEFFISKLDCFTSPRVPFSPGLPYTPTPINCKEEYIPTPINCKEEYIPTPLTCNEGYNPTPTTSQDSAELDDEIDKLKKENIWLREELKRCEEDKDQKINEFQSPIDQLQWRLSKKTETRVKLTSIVNISS